MNIQWLVITYRELAANGERPTVERIRAHLGTGSPNTVTRWLETWWKNLGPRLQPKRSDLKDAPAVLAELAGQWWALALEHARESISHGPRWRSFGNS